MAFTNNRVDFFEKESYTEKLHAFALVKGMENCVPQGLELTGNTLSNGYFANGGALGQLGNEGETHTITTNYTGFIVIKTTFNGVNSKSEIIESSTLLSTPLSDKGAIKYFTIYELSNGTIINDFRNRKYIKNVEVVSNGDDTFTIKINDKASNQFSTSVLQNAWTKSESDGRFKRIIDINSTFSDSEFDGMNMAQIMKYITVFVGNWGHTYEIVAECTNSTFPNVRNAVRSLVNELFETNITTAVLKFKVNKPRRSGLGGGDIMEVGFDNGSIFYLQYDNYGTNWETVNADAFSPESVNFGHTTMKGGANVNGNMVTTGSTTTGTMHINGTANITGNLNLDGTAKVGGNVESEADVSGQTVRAYNTSNGFILETESSSQLSTIYPLVVKYLSGTFRTSLVETSDTTGQYNAFFYYENDGTPNRVLRFYSSFAGGVLHTTPSASRKLAYEASMLLGQIDSLETQISLQGQIDAMKAPVVRNGVTKSGEILALEDKLNSVKNELNQLELAEELSHITTNIDALRMSVAEIDKSITKLRSKIIFKPKQKIEELVMLRESASSKLDKFEDRLLDYWQGDINAR